jgi:hypothetical protein
VEDDMAKTQSSGAELISDILNRIEQLENDVEILKGKTPALPIQTGWTPESMVKASGFSGDKTVLQMVKGFATLYSKENNLTITSSGDRRKTLRFHSDAASYAVEKVKLIKG